ncbi:futalosine hydrolase [Ammoniphilus sp. YIM 78166]|uniref:futalosine hydrolase n=1 Tax=Ammoniphilus sp. YIM 78166 TaxID=1644106 RepID=UPI00106FC806|nr:futalosine hydrolase [Ammoniphilus sp. YIM 78166]
MSKILVMTAVEVERQAVQRGLKGDSRFNVLLTGVGSASAAANTAIALTKDDYDIVISMGIAGGFLEKVDVGSLVIATEIIAADLGVETHDGFQLIEELGFGTNRMGLNQELVARVMSGFQQSGMTVQQGPIITVSTVTGTVETASALALRVPGAAAEAMEGYGVAIAAQQYGIPILEIRGISNAVGPRQRELWRIDDALHAIESASAVLVEVLT